jgi:hypothetical protein
MNDEGVTPKRSTGKWIFLGCLGCSGFMVLVIAALVFFNWTSIESAALSTKADLSELTAVSAALRDELGIAPGNVNSHKQGGVRTLRLTIPGIDLPGSELNAKAREIALVAARAHPDPGKFNGVQVTFVKGVGRIVKIESTRSFRFEMSELLADEQPR